MKIRRIAIVTLSAGAGELQASRAIHQALHDGADNVEAHTMDLLDLAEPWFRRSYAFPCWLTMRRAPAVWRKVFEWRQRKRLLKIFPDSLIRRGCERALNRLRLFRPHLVIAAETGAARLAALGRREGWFDVPILAAHTAFCAEPVWAENQIDVHCVGSEEAKGQLISWGVSANRIVTCGVPVDPACALSFDRVELRRAFGLHPSRPVVLVMGGGIRPAPLDLIIQSLEMSRHPIQVLALTARDHNLRRRLEAMRGRLALDLRVFGWSESILELMAAADLLITRPGGLVTSEALAAGLPMVLGFAAPGMEEAHLRFLLERNVAVAATRAEEISRLVSGLLDDPQRLEVLRARGREMARPDAAYAVAQVARALLEKATYIDLLAAPVPASGESAYVM